MLILKNAILIASLAVAFGLCLGAAAITAAGQDGGQATVISGQASNRMQQEVTSRDGVPLVKTPSVTLDAAPLAAANGPFATITWYGPGTASERPEEPSGPLAQTQQGNSMNLGVATFQDSKGVAQLMTEQHIDRQVVARVYTNRDVARVVEQLYQSTGLVKYRDKTEHLY